MYFTRSALAVGVILSAAGAMPLELNETVIPRSAQVAPKCNDAQISIGGGIDYDVLVDNCYATMNVNLYSPSKGTTYRDRCDLNKSKSFASNKTVWKAKCDSGNAHMEITGLPTRKAKAYYVQDDTRVPIDLTITSNRYYKCGEEGNSDANYRCQEANFQGCFYGTVAR